MAMMAIKGIYAEYGVQRLNHGIGFDTAAIELLLPTYAESLGLKGKICQHWALNPHPALIPAIEAGWVQSVHSFGSELGMEDYIRARPDVFFTGPDGSLRSHRAFCQAAGHYACDMFIGSTLQIDLAGQQLHRHRRAHRRLWRRAQHGRRCARPPPRQPGLAQGRRAGPPGPRRPRHAARPEAGGADGGDLPRAHAAGLRRAAGRLALAEQAGMDLPPMMIYGDDVTHVLTEEGIANLLLCRTDEEREQAIRGVAGYTPVGLARDARMVENLRDRGIIRRPADLGIDPRDATRNLLAARSVRDLVRASGGLYRPPTRFRNW
jgi:malonate decarboxylase alpha subunit